LTNSPNTSTMRPCRPTGPAILKSAAHPKESLTTNKVKKPTPNGAPCSIPCNTK
jgi:hypothetical protein